MKRFRLFAGPNGAGKSTLIKEVNTEFNLGYFINAYEIQKELFTKQFLHCSSYIPNVVTQRDWVNFIKDYKNQDARVDEQTKNIITIKENILVRKKEIQSYEAAVNASFFRNQLLHCDETFSFETVMSNPSKIDR